MEENLEKSTVEDPKHSGPWDRAGKFVDALGGVSSNVSSCIRKAKKCHAPQTPAGEMNAACQYEFQRFLKAASIKVPVFLLGQVRFPDSYTEKPYISAPDLMSLFTVHELSSILSLLYVFKRLRRRLIERDAEEWDRIAKVVEEQTEIGMMLGFAIPTLGFADSILVGGLRYLSTGMFALKDLKTFKDYRRDMKIKGVTHDLSAEVERWGCTHVDIAAMLLITLGFDRAFAHHLHDGLSNASDVHVSPEAIRMRIIGFWTDALHQGQTPPSIRGEENHPAQNGALDRLYDQCLQIRKTGVGLSWLPKGRGDVCREVFPQLFPPSPQQAEDGDEAEADVEQS